MFRRGLEEAVAMGTGRIPRRTESAAWPSAARPSGAGLRVLDLADHHPITPPGPSGCQPWCGGTRYRNRYTYTRILAPPRTLDRPLLCLARALCSPQRSARAQRIRIRIGRRALSAAPVRLSRSHAWCSGSRTPRPLERARTHSPSRLSAPPAPVSEKVFYSGT